MKSLVIHPSCHTGTRPVEALATTPERTSAAHRLLQVTAQFLAVPVDLRLLERHRPGGWAHEQTAAVSSQEQHP